MAEREIDLISIPSDIGSVYAGKSRAPAAFRAAGLPAQLRAAGYIVHEHSALPSPASWTPSSRGPSGARNEAPTVAACTHVATTISTLLSQDRAPAFHLLLSGECLFIPAILSAYTHYLGPTVDARRVGLLYFDADADLHIPGDEAGSGNIAGMTLTHLTQRAGALPSMKPFTAPGGRPVVDASNIVLFGLNMESAANARAHLGYLFDEGFRVFSSTAVQRDPEATAAQALKYLEDSGVEHVLVHLDVDVIDPGTFPLCNVPSWTGLGYEQAMRALKVFLGSERCVGLSVAEVNPDHDVGLGMTGRLVGDLVEGLGGREVRGLPSYSRDRELGVR